MEILSKINWVDVLVLILIVRTSYVSLEDGLSHEILPLVGSVCMLLFSLHYYTKIASFFYNNGLNLSIEILRLVSFILIAICIGIIFRFIKSIIDHIIKVTWHPMIEKFGGLLAGVVRGAILTSTVLIIIVLIPLPYLQWSVRDRSMTGMYFLRIGPFIYEKMHTALPTLKIGGSSIDVKEATKDILSGVSKAANKENKPAAKK